MNEGMRIVGYVRVSSAEQASSGLGLEGQRTAITEEAQRRGWELVAIYEDAAASGKSTNGRPGLAQALEAVETDAAAGIVVAKLDRLSRSIVDFGTLLERSRKNGWALVALDLGVDTSSAAGELVANVMVSVAQWERRAIGDRTRAALQVKRDQGIVLGRPRLMPAKIRRRIVRERSRGRTFAAIADDLNRDDVPRAQGGAAWHPATIRKVVNAPA